MSNFERYRKEYPKFVYKSYKVTETEEAVDIAYEFEICGLAHFSPT